MNITRDAMKVEENYKVKESDLIGEIKGFPIEIVQAMVNEQVKQGNKADVKVFQERMDMTDTMEGFCWHRSNDGWDFWLWVINKKDFNKFFEKYPKKDITNTYEAIKIIEHYNLNFALGNVINFVLRDRGTDREDYIKARYYLDRQIKKMKDK